MTKYSKPALIEMARIVVYNEQQATGKAHLMYELMSRRLKTSIHHVRAFVHAMAKG